MAWELFDSGTNQKPADAYSEAVVRYLKWMQTAAAHSIYTLQRCSPSDSAKSIAAAADWLAQAKPTGTQDRAFHLMGLASAQAKSKATARAARGLRGQQRPDSDWGQWEAVGSEAYATGLALYALQLSGSLAVSDPADQKGIAYPLRRQAEDGSWHVKTRVTWFQPYFESGFPCGHDQRISVAGSAKATMALSRTQVPRKLSLK